MRKQSNYWQGRFDQIEQSANNQSTKYIRSLEKKYTTAASEIDKSINAWYRRIAKNNNVSMTEARRLLSASELDEFKWTVQQYIEYGQANAVDQLWMKELENASAKFHISRLEAMKLEARQQVEQLFANGQETMYDVMGSVYKDSFYHSCFEIQKGVGVGFDVSRLDDKQVRTLLQKPWSVDGTNFSEKLWGNKKKLINTLDQELSRMILTGESPDKAIKNIRHTMGTSLSSAKRLVLTEQAYFTSIAQKDAYAELDVEEFEFVGTLDGKTCDDCGELDGQHFPMKDMLPGVNAAPMHPYCRCTTAPYFDDEFTIGKRIAKNEDGEYYEVPEKMTFSEWKKAFVDGDKVDVKTIEEKIASNNTKIETLTNRAKEVHSELEQELLFGDGDIDKMNQLQKQYSDLTDEIEAITSENEKLRATLPKVEVIREKVEVIEGKNLIGDIDYSDSEFDFVIEKTIHEQGFDGVPEIVEYEKFKKAMEESNFYAERTYSADTQELLDTYRNELYNGKWYIDCSEGGAQYGQGMYCASCYDITNNQQMGGIGFEMSHYQEVGMSRGHGFSYTESITMKPGAKILELPHAAKAEEYISEIYRHEYLRKFATKEQIRQVEEYIDYNTRIMNLTFDEDSDLIDTLYQNRANATVGLEQLLQDSLTALEDTTDGKKYHGLKNPGVLAAEMGYDAIKADGHGESGSYTVILNRTKVIFCEGGSIYGN